MMVANRHPEPADPLIDEVRAIRRAVCDAVGNDVDRLCDELARVAEEYRTRTGRFADVPQQAPENLFPEATAGPAAPERDGGRRR